MTNLIARLEAAPEGSRELDVAICEVVGECGIEEGARCCPNLCSSFSTSIDAKLADEDIVMASEQYAPEGRPRKWVALQRFPKGTYGRAATGYTEPLARRIAALRAMGDG